MRSLPRPSVWTALIGAAGIVGIALRVWILATPLGSLESDEAIVGLMALRALEGNFSVFYWGALYGGSQEALLTAGVFAVTGPSVIVLKLVSLAIFALGAVLTWRIGIRTVGEPAARLAAALFWVWPPFFVWWSTKSRGYFGSGLVLGALALLLALRLRERPSKPDALALGVVAGLGLWATLQTFLLAAPAIVWLIWRRPSVLRLAPLGLAGAVVGATPWLAWNALNGWKAVFPESVAGTGTTFGERFLDLFGTVLPSWLGLRTPWSLDWTFGRPLGVVVLALALAAFALALVRRPRGLEPLLVVAAGFPLLYAASSFTFFVFEPRYLVFLAPVLALLLAKPLARLGPVAAAVALLVASAWSVTGLVKLEREDRFRAIAQDVRVPTDLGPLLDLLERERVDRVLANYWVAYRISFESNERVIATSTGFVRYQPYDRLVRRSAYPARVYVAGSAVERRARESLEARDYRRLTAGGFVVYVHKS